MRFAVLLLLLFTCPARAQAPIDPGYFDLPAIHEPNIAIAPTLEPAAAATKAGGKLLSLVARVESSLIESNYQAHTEVVVEDGIYRWDCSGMMTWLLRKTAPVALSYVGSTRPVARDFVKAIASAPTNRVRGGWQRISNIPDLRPGDVFAFRRAAISTSKVTGHAGIVISAPVAVPYGLSGSRTRPEPHILPTPGCPLKEDLVLAQSRLQQMRMAMPSATAGMGRPAPGSSKPKSCLADCTASRLVSNTTLLTLYIRKLL
jgi:hypothetical protein